MNAYRATATGGYMESKILSFVGKIAGLGGIEATRWRRSKHGDDLALRIAIGRRAF